MANFLDFYQKFGRQGSSEYETSPTLIATFKETYLSYFDVHIFCFSKSWLQQFSIWRTLAISRASDSIITIIIFAHLGREKGKRTLEIYEGVAV